MFTFNYEKLIYFFVNEQLYKIIEKKESINNNNENRNKFYYLKQLKILKHQTHREYLRYIMIWIILIIKTLFIVVIKK